MNLFESVKVAVTVRQAVEHYGLEVNRGNMICCSFYDDRTPSMKLNEDYFYCFGCGGNWWRDWFGGKAVQSEQLWRGEEAGVWLRDWPGQAPCRGNTAEAVIPAGKGVPERGTALSEGKDEWSGFADLLANLIEKYAAALDLDNLPEPTHPFGNKETVNNLEHSEDDVENIETAWYD